MFECGFCQICKHQTCIAEVRICEVCILQIGTLQLCALEQRTGKIGCTEICITQICANEETFAQIRFAEIDLDVGVRCSPFVPNADVFFEHREMFGIGHGGRIAKDSQRIPEGND